MAGLNSSSADNDGSSPPRLSPSAFATRSFYALFPFLVVITILLPSGTVYGINFKLLLYVLLLPTAVVVFFAESSTVPSLALLVGVPSLLAFWCFIGVYNGFSLAATLRQYMDVILTIAMCWLATLYYGTKRNQQLSFLKLVLGAEVATCILKLGLIAYAVARGIPVAHIMEMIAEVFGVNLMTMDIGDLLGRVQFVSDALIPLCIFVVLRFRYQLDISAWRASFTVLLLFVSVLFSFSRYFWIYSLFSFILGLLLGRRDRFQISVLAVLSVATLASLPVLLPIYQLRFSETVTGPSDLDRMEQSRILQRFVLSAPLLGHGFGSYSPELIRESGSEAYRYSYEMQILALSGQIGIAGMVCFVGLLAWYYRNLWWGSPLSIPDRLGVSGMIVFWLCAGWYNPLLLNPVASVSYAVFAVLTEMQPEPVIASRSLSREA